MIRWLITGTATLLLVTMMACSSAPPSAAPKAPAASGTARPAGQPSATASPTPKVAVTTAPTQHVTADGRLSFVNDRGLTFGTGGQISKISVKELDKVSKGQVVASLDTTSLDQAVKTAEFGVSAADSAYKSATADRKLAEGAVTSAQADLKTMQSNVKSAQVDLDSASNTLNKLSYPYSLRTLNLDVPAAIQAVHDAQMNLDLAKTGLTAASGSADYNLAWDRFNKAMDSLKLAQGNLLTGTGMDAFSATSAQSSGTAGSAKPVFAVSDYWSMVAAQLSVGKAQVAVENAQNAVDKTSVAIDNANNALAKAQIAEDKAKTDVDRAKNDLDKAKYNRTQAIITAPFDGVIARVNSKELDLISSGSYSTTVVAEIIDPASMELDIQVNELDVPLVKVGQKAAIIVTALPGQKFEGTITSVASMPDIAGGVVSYEVDIAIAMPKDSALKAGMAASADISIPK